jgi:hypothetical protein
MEKVSAVILATLGVIAVGAILVFLFAFPVMWLWNSLIPQLFHGPVLSFWQTFGLLILVRMIMPTSTKTSNSSN